MSQSYLLESEAPKEEHRDRLPFWKALVDLDHLQPSRADSPPGALTLHTDRSSFRLPVVWSAGARFGDHAHPTAHRTFTQIDGGPRVWSTAERHIRVHSRSASTLGVGQYAARSKPADGGTLHVRRLRLQSAH